MRNSVLLSSFFFVVAMAGCQVGSAVGVPATTPAAPPPPGIAGATSMAGGAVGSSPDCPNPADHCLQEGAYMIADKDLSGPYTYVDAATPQTNVDGGGEATFFNLRTTQDQTTKWHYVTRPASDADLQVGRTVFMLHKRDGKIYRAPNSGKEAISSRWWMAKIASTAPLATNGYVVVTGGYKIAANALRVSDQIEHPTIGADLISGEDPHFLTANHWLVGQKALSGNYMYVDVSAPIQAPSPATKGDGHFISLRDGKVSWSKHAWNTRPATAADLRPGVQVFMLHKKDGGVYRAPKERAESLGNRWWTAKVIDNSQVYKGMVTVGGGYTIAIDAIRVSN